jgi:transposase
VSDQHAPAPLPVGLDLSANAWQQTPLRVRRLVVALLKCLAARAARVPQHSSPSSRPPSTDAPSTKRHRRMKAAERRQPGGQPRHPGHPQRLMAPTVTVALCPDGCACGHAGCADLSPSHTPQGIAVPVMPPDVTHGLLHHGRWCLCGPLGKASLPAAQGSGEGPLLTSCIGELAGIVGASRSAVP